MKKTIARPLGAGLITASIAVAMAGLTSMSASADTGSGTTPANAATVATATATSAPTSAASAASTSGTSSGSTSGSGGGAASSGSSTSTSTSAPDPAGQSATHASSASTGAAAAKAVVKPNAVAAPQSVISGAITNVSIQQTSAGQYQAMQVDLDWSVPSTAKPGDTFSLTLPPELVSNTASFNLLAPDGSVVATCSVVNGVATFTLTNYVATHQNVSGSAFFSVNWAKSESTVTGPVHMVFTAGTKTFPVTVNHNGSGGNGTKPQKSGNWTNPNQQTGVDAISWHVFTPVGPFTTAQLSDVAGPDQTIDCTTVSFKLGSGVDASGKPTSLTKLPAKDLSGYTCTTAGLSATVGPVGADQDVQLTYQSTPTSNSAGSFPNSVTMTVDGTTFKTVTATVKRTNAGGNGGGDTGSPTVSPTSTATTPSTSTSPTVKAEALTSGGTLPYTGSNVLPMLALAALLLLGGLGLLIGVPRSARRH